MASSRCAFVRLSFSRRVKMDRAGARPYHAQLRTTVHDQKQDYPLRRAPCESEKADWLSELDMDDASGYQEQRIIGIDAAENSATRFRKSRIEGKNMIIS